MSAPEPAATVLVADDQMPVRLFCRLNLESEGMRVLEAEDGAAALELARRERPSLIVLDVMMPHLSGWEVAEHVLGDPETAAIPIVFISARADFRDQAKGLEIGAVDYLTKPFEPSDFTAVVRRLLRDDGGARDRHRAEKLARVRELLAAY